MGMRLNFNNDQNHYWTSISQKMRWRLLRSVLPLPPPPKKDPNKTNKTKKQTNKQRNQPEAKRHFYPDTIMFR